MSWKEKCAPSIPGLVDDLKAFLQSGKSELIIPTPFPELNSFLGGGIQGFVCIGSAPGMGKSTMAQQISVYTANRGIPVIYVDLEHSKIYFTLRLLASLTYMTIEDVKIKLMGTAGIKIPPMMNLFRVWNGAVDPRDIRYNLKALDCEDHLCLIVVDSLQKLSKIPNSTTARDRVDTWLRELEAIKNDYPCVILTVSELSRGEGGKNYTSPSLSSLKESGDAEYTAEQVLLISGTERDSKYSKLHLVKNRYGPTGEIPATYMLEGGFLRWKEISNEEY